MLNIYNILNLDAYAYVCTSIDSLSSQLMEYLPADACACDSIGSVFMINGVLPVPL